MCGGCAVFGLGAPVAETCVVVGAEVEAEEVEAEVAEEWPKCKGYNGKGCKHNNRAGPRRGTKYGLCPVCKEKQKGYDDERRNKRKREAMENPAPEGHQRCTGPCKKIHPISEFVNSINGTTTKVCRACRASITKSAHNEATVIGGCNKVIKDFKETNACVGCGCNDWRLITADHVYPKGSITDENDWRYPLMKQPGEPDPSDASGWAKNGGPEALRKRLYSGAVVARCVFCHNLKDNAQTSKAPESCAAMRILTGSSTSGANAPSANWPSSRARSTRSSSTTRRAPRSCSAYRFLPTTSPTKSSRNTSTRSPRSVSCCARTATTSSPTTRSRALRTTPSGGSLRSLRCRWLRPSTQSTAPSFRVPASYPSPCHIVRDVDHCAWARA